MSVSGIGSYANMPQMSSVQDRKTQWQSQLQQVGTNLPSGNLTQAQTDFSSLVQSKGKGHHHHHHGGQIQASSSTAADQQAFATIQQDLQQGAGASVSGAATSSVAQATGNLINVTG